MGAQRRGDSPRGAAAEQGPRRRERTGDRDRPSRPVRPQPPGTRGGDPPPRRARRRGAGRRRSGATLTELLVGVALLGIMTAVAVPAAMEMHSAATAEAASREFAALFRRLRYQAISTRRHHGVWFEHTPEGWTWAVYRDRDGDGLRSAEIRAGREDLVEGPFRVPARWSGLDLAVPPGDPPRGPPPGRTDLGDGDPVRFGRSDLVSFTPLGTSSSGTLYLGNARRHWAVVVYGPTVRVRLWERRPAGWTRR